MEEYEAIRRNHATPRARAVPIAEARARRTPIEWQAEDIAQPYFTGVHVLDDFPLQTLCEFIDWSPFFHTWGLKGIYPRILDSPEVGEQARQIFADGKLLLERMVRDKLLRARGVYGLFPAAAIGDDIELYTDSRRAEPLERFSFLRQQVGREGSEPCRSLADFVAPQTTGLADHVGAFAVTSGVGLKALTDAFRADNDDYHAIMAEALADRLAEAFAEALHKRVRDQWGYGLEERLSPAQLIDEGYRGIRPAPGYPACPDHTEKEQIWRLLKVEENTGILLTESFAMWPGSSVSGLYFAHPKSRYFSLGRVDRDQVEDYAARKRMTMTEAERWLGPYLNYEPQN